MCMGFACIYVCALCVCSALQRSNHLTLELWMGDHEPPCGSSGRPPPTELSLQPSSEKFKALVFSFKPCHPHFTNSCWPPTQVLNMLSISGLGSKWMKYFVGHGSPAPHRCLWTRQHPCTHLTPYSSYEEMLPRTWRHDLWHFPPHARLTEKFFQSPAHCGSQRAFSVCLHGSASS